MNAYKNIINIVDEFLHKKNDAKESEAFSELFMDMFFDFNDELYKELPRNQYDILSDMNYACDLYEKCPAIREAETFCLDEEKLKNKIEKLRNTLKHGEV